VRDMVSAPRPNFSPSMLHDGAIVIADFPVLQYRDVGQQIQVILKYCLQRATARRDVSRNPRGVFIGADEHQYLAVEADQVAQTTARSSHLAVVNATQSLSTYLAAFGPQSESRVHSLLGNLQTQIFHQQTDTETIRYIQELVGRSRQFMMNGNSARGGDWLAPLFGEGSGGSAGFSETYEYELQARDLNGLAKGGPPHFTTEAIVYQGGRTFPNGRTWLPVTFRQKR
jgi:type IV secretory system conjugative DNA transfer VirD4/TraG family protein